MIQPYSIIVLVIGITLVSVSLYRLKKQVIGQGAFTLWTLVGVVFLLIAAIPTVIFNIQNFLGTQITLSAVFGVSFVFLILLVFYLHQRVDMLNQRITKLVSKLGADYYFKSNYDKS